jgi:hypothetical protein
MTRRLSTVDSVRVAAALLFPLAALRAPAAAQQPPRQTDRDRDELVGTVKTVAVETSSAPGAEPEPVTTSTYTPDGDLLERVYYVGGRVVARADFRTTDGGFRIMTTTAPAGVGFGIRSTKLQPQEEPASPFVAAADGTYTFVLARAYDAAGRLLSEAVHAGSDPKKVGAPIARLTYRYDDKGRISEVSRLYGTPQRAIEKRTYAYDANGYVQESIHYRMINMLPSRSTYAYEFDSHGNWTKRAETQVLKGIPVVTFTTRTITYY